MYTNCLAKLDGLGMGGSSCLVFVSVFVVAVFLGGWAKELYSKCCIFIKNVRIFYPQMFAFNLQRAL